MTTPSNRSPEAPVYRRGGKGKLPPPSLRISRVHLDHHAFHAGAGPSVEFGPVHVVEPAAPLELCLELEAHVVLTRELGQRERIPKRPRSGADVDDVDEDYFRALPSTSGFTTLIALPAT